MLDLYNYTIKIFQKFRVSFHFTLCLFQPINIKALSLLHALHAHTWPNVILNHTKKHPKIEGRFSHGEALYGRRGRFYFDGGDCSDTVSSYRVYGGLLHFSQGENLLRGRLYFVTTAPNKKPTRK